LPAHSMQNPQNDYLPRKAAIVSCKDLSAKEKMFRLVLKDGGTLGHIPGQFIMIGLTGIGEAPISICSSPTEGDYFELCVRDVGNVTHALHSLQKNDEVFIRGPYRNKGFPVDILKERDLVIVGGGLGIVPLRSLVNYVKDRRSEFRRVVFLYGTKNTGSVLFLDEIEEAQRKYGFECLISLDRAVKSWGGNIGLITTLISNIKIPLKDCNVVIVGPPIMYRFVLKELFTYGVKKENIYLSLERNMKCGIGRCGRCQMGHFYTCMDGPVFNYADIEKTEGAI
jgi:sulfhydrogenase subunit gamma (sulfur reductase)